MFTFYIWFNIEELERAVARDLCGDLVEEIFDEVDIVPRRERKGGEEIKLEELISLRNLLMWKNERNFLE